LDLTKPIVFDAKKSQSSNRIVEFFWDFADTTSSNDPTPTHQYNSDGKPGLQSQLIFPVLRIKDEHGFISDSFVQIENVDLISDTSTQPTFKRIVQSKRNSFLDNRLWIV